MTSSGQPSDLPAKAVLTGLAGYIGWRFLGPARQKKLLRFLDGLMEAAAESERKRLLAEKQARQQHEREALLRNLMSGSTTPAPKPIASEPVRIDWDIPSLAPFLGSKPEDKRPKAVMEPDARWRSLIVPPSVVVIVGKRGSGKSALAYRLLELFRYHLTPYVVGVPAEARKHLPDWIGMAPTLDDLPPRSIALVDEAYMLYHSRHSMAQDNRSMSQVVNLSRQRDQTLIFVSQEARQIDKNIASSANVLVFKETGMLQPDFDRKELRKIAEDAQKAFSNKKGTKQRWSYVYSPDADYAGMVESKLPSFWKPSLSRLFALGQAPSSLRPARKLTPQVKTIKAKELRSKGYSYSQIARELGVSKSTVVNYLKGYPYR